MPLNSTALPTRQQPDRHLVRRGVALRIGIVHQGQVVHEQVFSESKRVRIGSHHSADIVLAPGQVPESRTLFTRQGETWQLCLQGQDQGRISEGKVRDLAQRISSGDTQIPLSTRVKGKLSLGEVTVLFQLVPAPSAAMQPGAFKPRLIDQDDPVFLGSLALISSAAAVLMIWVMQQEPVQRVTIEDLSPHVAEMIFEQRPTVEDIEALIAPDPEAPGELVERIERPEPGERGGPSSPQDPGPDRPLPTRQELRQQANNAIQALLIGSTDGDTSRRTERVFGHNDQVGSDLAGLLDQQHAVQEAGFHLGAKAGTELNIGTVGVHGTETHQTQVGIGPGTEPTVKGKRPSTDEVTTSDGGELERLIRRQLGPAVKTCYEQALNRSPSAGGRIEIRLELFDGEVMDLGMAHNDIDSEMSACLGRASSRWAFSDAEGTLVVPYVLSPSQ